VAPDFGPAGIPRALDHPVARLQRFEKIRASKRGPSNAAVLPSGSLGFIYVHRRAMNIPWAAHRVRSRFLRVGAWASAAAFVLIEGYALADQWLIGRASALFMLGTALLSAGICIGLFALVALIGFAVSLFFAEPRPNPVQEPSGRVGSIGHRSNPRAGSRKPDAIRTPSRVAKRKRHLRGLSS
jgi:hypothetical protein